jgi:CubicO group peptidase (beta-lactamase class C family)
MKAETARLARSNLLPAAVRYEGGGFGAGMRVAAGGKMAHDAAGAVSWNGAAGTMWLVDPERRLNFVFMSQFMPPTSYSVWTEVDSALDAAARRHGLYRFDARGAAGNRRVKDKHLPVGRGVGLGEAEVSGQERQKHRSQSYGPPSFCNC